MRKHGGDKQQTNDNNTQTQTIVQARFTRKVTVDVLNAAWRKGQRLRHTRNMRIKNTIRYEPKKQNRAGVGSHDVARRRASIAHAVVLDAQIVAPEQST